MAIDPPYRFDPFQNLVNVSWQAIEFIALEFAPWVDTTLVQGQRRTHVNGIPWWYDQPNASLLRGAYTSASQYQYSTPDVYAYAYRNRGWSSITLDEQVSGVTFSGASDSYSQWAVAGYSNAPVCIADLAAGDPVTDKDGHPVFVPPINITSAYEFKQLLAASFHIESSVLDENPQWFMEFTNIDAQWSYVTGTETIGSVAGLSFDGATVLYKGRTYSALGHQAIGNNSVYAIFEPGTA